MGWFGKKKQTEARAEIRDTLFGDQPFGSWANHASMGEPWLSFTSAKAALDRGDQRACIEILTGIADRKNLESRHYVQAWEFLRQLGVLPPKEKEKELYGVVVEAGLNEGLDIIAAYADLSARYYNYSGAGVVWERPDATLDAPIQQVLSSGRVVAAQLGPWKGPRPPVPPQGIARINMLTPSGLHFGEGSLQALASDPLGGPVIATATVLMRALIGKTKK